MNDSGHVSLEQATQLLKQILATRSPELGARLKQRLNASLREQGRPPFNEMVLGHKGFQSFLEKSQSAWLQVTKPTDNASGDILVALKGADPSVSAELQSANSEPLPRFRNEVWQAFTNPDSMRKRYIDRLTLQVLHFKVGDKSPEELAHASAPGQFIEITFIAGDVQRAWMEAFLNAVPIVGDERKTYESMLSAPYSSAMNAAFTRSLGSKHQEPWREFRTTRVTAAISSWATQHALPIRNLLRQNTTDAKQVASDAAPRSKAPLDSSRRDALALLELLSDHEVKSIVLPVLLSTMLLRSRT